MAVSCNLNGEVCIRSVWMPGVCMPGVCMPGVWMPGVWMPRAVLASLHPSYFLLPGAYRVSNF